jgi:signal transduction histidine kinase/streptogramin lyase
MLRDREGNFWVGTQTELARLDAGQFELLTETDGLISRQISSLAEDSAGDIWVGTREGLSRWTGESFTSYTVANGLPNNRVSGLLADEDGTLWVTFFGGGFCRRQSEQFECFSEADGLPTNHVHHSTRAADGSLWLASNIAGSIRFDGETFTSVGTAQGLPNDVINAIAGARDGSVWMGTWVSGVNRLYNGRITSLTKRDGLAEDEIFEIFEDSHGQLWFASLSKGVSRYDGSTLTTVGSRDGLVSNRVRHMIEDRQRTVWFGTDSGISRFDGAVFQSLTQRDGLPGVRTQGLLEDRHGRIWIGMPEVGLVRYSPRPVAPIISIANVIGEQRMGPVSEIVVPTTLPRLVFEFHAISFRTRPEAMIYRYRLVGYNDDWQLADGGSVEYEELPTGDYVFEVVAVDRDLNYSEEPARVNVVVQLPDSQIALWSLLGLASIGLVFQAYQIVQRNRRLRRANRDLEQANRAETEARQTAEEAQQTAEDALSDLKQAQAQLVQSEKMASLGVLTAGIAHEVNNPINFVTTSCKALKNMVQDVFELFGHYDKLTSENVGEVLEEVEDLKEAIEYDELQEGVDDLTGNITSGAQRTADIVKGLQTFSRLEEGEKKRVDLHENLDSVLLMLHSRYDGILKVEKEYGEIPPVDCFPGQLNQAFMNVLINGIEAIERKEDRSDVEEIRIRTSTVEVDGAMWVEISISDTGTGIPKDLTGRIFEPFFTTKDVGEGTGLGLAMSLGIVEDHGGKIEVEREDGKGATVVISLPVIG